MPPNIVDNRSDVLTILIECYKPDADGPHVKEIRDQCLHDEHPRWWYLKQLSKTLSIIFRHDLKYHEQKLDPVYQDE